MIDETSDSANVSWCRERRRGRASHSSCGQRATAHAQFTCHCRERFDTTTAEAEGMPPWTEKYLTDVF